MASLAFKVVGVSSSKSFSLRNRFPESSAVPKVGDSIIFKRKLYFLKQASSDGVPKLLKTAKIFVTFYIGLILVRVDFFCYNRIVVKCAASHFQLFFIFKSNVGRKSVRFLKS
jgi:hypothetical protein